MNLARKLKDRNEMYNSQPKTQKFTWFGGQPLTSTGGDKKAPLDIVEVLKSTRQNPEYKSLILSFKKFTNRLPISRDYYIENSLLTSLVPSSH